MLEIPGIDPRLAETILGMHGSCEEMIEIDSLMRDLHGNRRPETREEAHWIALQNKVARGNFPVTATETTKAGHLRDQGSEAGQAGNL